MSDPVVSPFHQRKPEIGSLWRDREGNVWRLARYNDGGPWCNLEGVTRFDGVPFHGAIWHCDWLVDLIHKAAPIG